MRKRDAKPGCLPEPALSRLLDDETTLRYLELVAARGDAAPRKRSNTMSSTTGAAQESVAGASS